MPTTDSVLAGRDAPVGELGALHGRVADELGVVTHDGEVVQRMHELHLAGNLERAREDQAHVAHGNGHGVAVDDHESAHGIDHQTRAAVVALGDARHRVRHVEAHAHHGRRQRRRARIIGLAEARAATGIGLGGGQHRQRGALPQARRVVAQAVIGREPAAVHARAAHRLEPLGSSTVE